MRPTGATSPGENVLPDGVDQRVRLDRLPQPVVDGERPGEIRRLLLRRADDHGDAPELRIPRLLSPELQTVHDRHLVIDDDQTRGPAAAEISERLLAMHRDANAIPLGDQ